MLGISPFLASFDARRFFEWARHSLSVTLWISVFQSLKTAFVLSPSFISFMASSASGRNVGGDAAVAPPSPFEDWREMMHSLTPSAPGASFFVFDAFSSIGG